MFEVFADPQSWVALATLTALEIVLGIDNVVFIAILTAKLPTEERKLAYRLGLGGAMFMRIGLLLAISWVIGLTDDLFTLFGETFSGRDLILLGGGLFLIAKSTHEIYEKIEVQEEAELEKRRRGLGLAGVVAQIMVLDMVFSLDSVITAVGMVDPDKVIIMVTAVVISIGIMLAFARPIGDFVNRNPSMKILALSFLLLIGVLLTAEGLGQHLNKGYIYFAMGFSLLVELLNMRFRKKATTVPAAGSD
jgi:predicted tellurium resistance membrane protein TerC